MSDSVIGVSDPKVNATTDRYFLRTGHVLLVDEISELPLAKLIIAPNPDSALFHRDRL